MFERFRMEWKKIEETRLDFCANGIKREGLDEGVNTLGRINSAIALIRCAPCTVGSCRKFDPQGL
jgi:hypothetical protein